MTHASRRTLLVAAVTSAVAALVPAPADAQRRFSCKDARGSTVVQTREARVYAVSGGRNAPSEYFACLLSRRAQRVELGTNDVESSIDRPVLAGRFLAFGRTDASPVSGEVERSAVEVWDLRRRRQRFEFVEGQPSEDPNVIVPYVETVVLTRSASVAWTSSAGAVRRSQAFAAPETLEAAGADSRSLALSLQRAPDVHRLYWALVDGSVRFSTLR